MSMVGTSVDDPHTLRKLMAMAQPNQSHVGRMLDAGRAHIHVAFSGGGSAGVAAKSHSVAKKERDRLLQLQREQQAAWDVSATRGLVLPALRTMAPSFTKTSDEGYTELGGTKIGGAGYNTIIGMVPTAETIRCIADEDELISSFRPYRIDVMRAATAATEIAPHPDDARVLEPTLLAINSSRLIDGPAIPADIISGHWGTASVFAAASQSPLSLEQRPQTAESTQFRSTASPHGILSGTANFSVSQRFKEGKSFPGVRQPAIGHYHLRYSQVDPRVTGGYISPQGTAAVYPRGAAAEAGNGTADVKRMSSSPRQSPVEPGFIPGTESTRDYGLTATKTARLIIQAPENVHKPLPQPANRGSSMFVSVTERSAPTAGCAARDLDYWPYADVRSTSKRPKCAVKLDVKFNERRHDWVASSPSVGQYDVAGDISRNLSRVVCMDRNTGRSNDWRSKTVAHEDEPDVVDVSRALEVTRPRMRCVTMAPRVLKHEETEKKVPDTTVSIEMNLDYPRTTFNPREVRKVRQFSKMIGRDAMKLHSSYEPPENVELQLVTKRSPAISIHPMAPGHAPLHRPNPTEIGEVPNLKYVRPTVSRTIRFGVGAGRPFAGAHMYDLRYDTEKRLLVDPRTTGDPMMDNQVSRERRAKVFTTSGCGAVAVYNTDIPIQCKSVPLFEKQITKETQFCGHRLQSERWERNNPKAPGPGHYDVSFRLVE